MKLILENWKKYLKEISLGEPTKSIEYTAFVLEDNSELLKYVPEGWKAFAHHMTLLPPPEMKRRLPSHWLEYEGCLDVIGIARNDQVIAARIEIPSDLPIPFKIRGLPHVTIATNPKTGGKAEMSNDFVEEDFESLENGPIKVCGKVEEVLR